MGIESELTSKTEMDIYVNVESTTVDEGVRTNKRYLNRHGDTADIPVASMTLTEGLQAAWNYKEFKGIRLSPTRVMASNFVTSGGTVYPYDYSLVNLLQFNIPDNGLTKVDYQLYYPNYGGYDGFTTGDNGEPVWLRGVASFKPHDLYDIITLAFKVHRPINTAKVANGNGTLFSLLELLDNLLGDATEESPDMEANEKPEVDNGKVPDGVYLGDEQFKGWESTVVPTKYDDDMKYAFIYKEDPRFGLEWMSSDGVDDYVTLTDHDSLEQVALLVYKDVENGPFNLDKFYVIPVEGESLTIQWYTDFIYLKGSEAGKAMDEFLDKTPSTNIDEYNE